MPAWRLYDTHCHLSQMANAEDVAHEAAELGLAIFDCGVEPSEFPATCETLGGLPNIAIGVGLHPWWISSGRCDVETADAGDGRAPLPDCLGAAAGVDARSKLALGGSIGAELGNALNAEPRPSQTLDGRHVMGSLDCTAAEAMLSGCESVGLKLERASSVRSSEDQTRELVERVREARYIGEVGLDFSAKHVNTRQQQVHAFDELCKTLAEHPLPGRVLSVHAVQSATTVLDILEKYDLVGAGVAAAQNASAPATIFHWFSGSGDELLRARRCGCYFSVNEMMLKTKRGRAYAIQIPENQLLLETDAPPELGKPYSAQNLVDQLDRTLDTLADLRNTNKEQLAQAIAKTSTALLGI